MDKSVMENRPQIELSSGVSRLSIAQSTGKITSLLFGNDNLLVEPLPHELKLALSDTDRAQFESLDAWGGDDCFPTIAGSDLWQLRDHGNVWGKTPNFNFAHNDSCETGWQWSDHYFKRKIEAIPHPSHSNCLGVYCVKVDFSAFVPAIHQNETRPARLPVQTLYGSHMLFAAQPGDTVEWGVIKEHASLQSLHNGQYLRQIAEVKQFAPNALPIASKFYVECSSDCLFFTSLIRRDLGIRIDVIQNNSLPYVGIWWCHNAWGDGRPHSTVGIEPTNLPSDGPILSLAPRTNGTERTGEFLWVIHKTL